MSVDRLVAALDAADIGATATEVAEAVWLAARIAEAAGTVTGDDLRPVGADAAPPAGDAAGQGGPGPEPVHESVSAPPRQEDPAPDPAPADDAFLYPPEPAEADGPGGLTNASAVRSPAAAALPGGLELLRALRPLKRRVPSARRTILDETATADRIADERLVLPLLLPAPERWLSLLIVVDAGSSMAVWRPLVDELRELFERLGAFRDVRLWHLGRGGDGTLGVAARAVPTDSLHSPRELVDPSGRQAVLVVSDCVDDIWWSGEAHDVLRLWGRTGPLAVLQPLPQRLWHRTGAGPVAARVHSTAPGIPNTGLIAEPYGATPLTGQQIGMPVPVLEIEPDWLASWARLVTGAAHGGIDAMVATTPTRGRDGPGRPWAGGTALGEAGGATAADLVGAFRSAASPQAFRLAGYLAAAPLTLPVMRLVQHTMLPGTRPAHLAEVFVSGLIRKLGAAEEAARTPYDFVPGVRDVLLGTIRASETVRVHEQVSAYVAESAGRTRDTTALLPSPQGQGEEMLDTARQPFAVVPVEVLRRLGAGTGTGSAAPVTPPPSAREPAPEGEPWRSPRPAELEASPRAGGGTPTFGLVHQPMLFVGLGGTGLRIGAALEHALRSGLCGPDGTRLVAGGRRLPFQLPDFLQFVYADMSESQIQRLADGVQRNHRPAHASNSRVLEALLPPYDSSPEVARMLRVALHEETRHWLPPKERQPRVAPLRHGAGQLPTVGRASLFAAMSKGPGSALGQLRQAIGALANSAGDLREVGGRAIRGCDVFVAFSVAGGTGAGVFYDFLHLIGDEFRRSRFPNVRIYPLVVMPSAFPSDAGGGREAELNAARALVDLARLIDDQNAPAASADFGDVLSGGSPSVRYPGDALVRLSPSTVQTAILFGRSKGMQPDDLRRSVIATVTSLIGTGLESRGRDFAADEFPSFAANFANRSVERATVSRTGIGLRPLSTSLAASLSVPVGDLAEIVANRLLAQAVRAMDEEAGRAADDGAERVREMFDRSGIGPLWAREVPTVPSPDLLPRGTRAIARALRDRLGDMEDALGRLQRDLDVEVPRLAERFRPDLVARELIGEVGPFRLERLLTGLPGHPQQVAELGFAGVLGNRAHDPARVEGVDTVRPEIRPIRRSVGGLVPARWGDPQVQSTLDEQDAWYEWRGRQKWHRGWKDQESRWRPSLLRTTRETGELVKALRGHEEDERRHFVERRDELYRQDRVGVRYLLPPQWMLAAFYDEVFGRLLAHEGLPEHQDAAGLLARIIQPHDWVRALESVRRSPQAGVQEIKQVVERRVKRLLGESSAFDDRPLLPSLGVLLQAAAGDENTAVGPHWLDQLRHELAGLLPVGFEPDGTGQLKVLVTYPQTAADSAVASLLARDVRLPYGTVPEFRAVDTESVTVVLFRSGMSLTDVSEVRQVLRLWAGARDAAGVDDFLHWRQRLGYRDDWLVGTEEDRCRILHRILCAVWNGQVDVAGSPDSPEQIRIRLAEGDASTLTLPLESLSPRLSSWGSLLRAYEKSALLGQEACELLMRTQPEGLAATPVPPAPLFRHLVLEVAPRQLELIGELAAQGQDEEWLEPLHHFWKHTLPDALDLRFPDTMRGAQPTLRALAGLSARRAAGGAHREASPWDDHHEM
ncbi:SAV_2336 N-terminal domain-related protein [Streptomyces pristinaespiralis]|uniref:Metallophosphoesterase n=1 Tax=Streptomyces pristinaespiralis TaxID=38300 RepID=A0A0M5IPZ8_STRPR|nr:tubulin-like doman-containing protein [Streptomyces pristinaespiralis]ALC19574.1 metallophosphoesterase [Streptomyces pristinaespiralis]